MTYWFKLDKQHIYDYGYTLGAAILSIALPTVGGHYGEGEAFATIGKGIAECSTSGGICILRKQKN